MHASTAALATPAEGVPLKDSVVASCCTPTNSLPSSAAGSFSSGLWECNAHASQRHNSFTRGCRRRVAAAALYRTRALPPAQTGGNERDGSIGYHPAYPLQQPLRSHPKPVRVLVADTGWLSSLDVHTVVFIELTNPHVRDSALNVLCTALGVGLAEVVLVEASAQIGGRVREAKGLMPWGMNVGPEFIHGGKNSPLVDLIRAAGWRTHEHEWPDLYWFGKVRVYVGVRLLSSAKDAISMGVVEVVRLGVVSGETLCV